jgi:hypothetical protein
MRKQKTTKIFCAYEKSGSKNLVQDLRMQDPSATKLGGLMIGPVVLHLVPVLQHKIREFAKKRIKNLEIEIEKILPKIFSGEKQIQFFLKSEKSKVEHKILHMIKVSFFFEHELKYFFFKFLKLDKKNQ